MNNTSTCAADPCPYCGSIGGHHSWAGDGSCPGAADSITLLQNEIRDLKHSLRLALASNQCLQDSLNRVHDKLLGFDKLRL